MQSKKREKFGVFVSIRQIEITNIRKRHIADKMSDIFSATVIGRNIFRRAATIFPPSSEYMGIRLSRARASDA